MAEATTHKVTRSGKSCSISVEHSSCQACQFDFYIPKNLWRIRIVKNFLDTLSALGGATVFDDEIGIWKGEKEKTQVFRLVVRHEDMEIDRVREILRKEVGQLMAMLSQTRHAQETLLYTETAIWRYAAEKLKRID